MNQNFRIQAFNEIWSALRLPASYWVTQALLQHFQKPIGIDGLYLDLEKRPKKTVNNPPEDLVPTSATLSIK